MDSAEEEIARLLEGIKTGRLRVLSYESEWLTRRGESSNIREVTMQLVDSAIPIKRKKMPGKKEEKPAKTSKRVAKKIESRAKKQKLTKRKVSDQPHPVAPRAPDMADMTDIPTT